MYYIEWRGYGLLGILPPPLGLIALGFLIEGHSFRAAALAATLTIATAGTGLGLAGWSLNGGGKRHSLYALPLWFWGAVYAVLGLGLAGWIGCLVIQSGWKD